MSEWQKTTIGELGRPGPTGFATGPFGSAVSSKHFVATGIPMIRGSNLSEDVSRRLVDSGYVFLPAEIARKFQRSVVRRGDLVFTCWGTIGQAGYIGDEAQFDEYLVSNKQMKMSVDPMKADSLFVYYLMSQSDMVEYVKSEAIGSSVPGFNLGQLKTLQVRIPSLLQQRAIANVLSALDDKIAANTKFATTADELVRTEYHALGASAQESVTLGSLAKNIRDLAEPDGSDSLYVGLEHVPRHLMWLTGSGSMADVSSTKARFAEQDVLFGKLRPYFHKVVAAPSSGVCSTDILVLRTADAELAGFVLAAAASDAVVGAVTASSEGTRMPRASWKDLAACEVPWPGDAVARAFSVRVAALRDHIQARLRENEGLTAIRDALLPALMSGRLTVRDAEAGVASGVDSAGVEPEVLANGTLW